MSLDRKIHLRLESWLNAGLITDEQANAIRNFEREQSGSALTFWLMWLAGSSVALGIIALIAANWQVIPPIIKLVLYFAGYLGAGFALVRTLAGKPVAQEVLRLTLMLYTMAGIGLVAQIYHLHSAPYRGVLFWCALTFGLALSGQSFLGAAMWLSGLFLAFGMFLDTRQFSSETNSYIFLFMVCVLGVMGSRKRLWPNVAAFQNAGFVLSSLVAFLYSLIAIYAFEDNDFMTRNVLIAVFAVLGIWGWALFSNKTIDRITRVAFVIFLAFVGLQSLTLFGTSSSTLSVSLKLLSILEYGLGTLSLAIAAFSFGKRRVFEALILMVFLRLFMIYGEFMFSALASGFGFISFGLLLFAAIYVWKKFRTTLFQKLEAKINASK